MIKVRLLDGQEFELNADTLRWGSDMVLEVLDEDEEIIAVFQNWNWARVVDPGEVLDAEVLDTSSYDQTGNHDGHVVPDGHYVDPGTADWPSST